MLVRCQKAFWKFGVRKKSNWNHAKEVKKVVFKYNLDSSLITWAKEIILSWILIRLKVKIKDTILCHSSFLSKSPNYRFPSVVFWKWFPSVVFWKLLKLPSEKLVVF